MGMTLESIPIDSFHAKPFHLFDKEWMLLTAGNFSKEKFNTMTISWGSLGVMWNRPFVQVVARPTRYTHDFLEASDSFTLSAFPETFRGALRYIGSRSGREGNKILEAHLTPVASTCIDSPTFAEAELVIECQKIYRDELKSDLFLDPSIEHNYPNKDYHTIYFGEILAIQGVSKYRQ